VLEPTPDGEHSELLGFQMKTWPEGAPLTEVRGGGTRQHPQDPTTRPVDNLFHMNGTAIYKMALRRMPAVLKPLFAATGTRPEDVRLLVPHQASKHAVQAAVRFGFASDVVVNRIADEGNCVAAAMPMALAFACHEDRLRRGDLVLFCGTGAGLSALALLMRW
jgi:3-oxoacyl-[acyl-carrier-protein] synthase-3